ncbi:hypothetical protein CU098_006086 [Rhizopus stolonifer]|uniref:Arrestin C-terminal-like domain-containing protein n=1 Tax=Rhizopus stolonifer TaxID=4846 RepID=A0A367J2A7_RHIST|nr:hypothetical protein CU098_006086 [Rhizopus stolonifer]
MSLIHCYNWANLAYQALHSPKIEVYTKSPFVIAGYTLSGTVVVGYPHNLVGLSLTMIGKEAGDQKHVFLKECLVRLDSLDGQNIIPFDCKLPTMSNGTYKHKRGSIQYYIQCEVWYTRFNKVECLKIKKPIQVYSNRDRWVDQDQAISFLSSDRYVAIDFHMLQSIWVSNNTDIAVHLTIQNNNTHYINQVKLKLLRQIGKRIETVNTSSSLKWWQPLAPKEKDDLIMTISPPANEFSVDQQKEMNISFFIQAFVYVQSSKKGILVANIPILLVHPMSCSKLPMPPSSTSLLPRPPTMIPYPHQTLLGKVKHSFSSWIERSSTLASFSTNSSCTTIQNVESYATEKVEI